ncbi:MAG: biotin/lipoyl-binding protein [Ruminococcaceae bacterium]|nr:biotin/lipoyl-binding protein [Oscillospiraceae bacterium]
MKTKILAILLALLLALTSSTLLLTGCGGDTPTVSVQSVGMITGADNTAVISRFAGVVVSSGVVNYDKGEGQKVVDINVKVGDAVTAGDVLFSYDEQSLKLNHERLTLQKEQYQKLIDTMKKEIEALKKKVTGGSSSTQLEYSIQLQTLQIDLKETEFKLATVNSEIDEAKKMLSKADVVCKVDGRVQSINEDGVDDNGNPAPFITIVETGAFRVEGRVSELNLKDIYVGLNVIVRSRTFDNIYWTGVVDELNLDSPAEDGEENMYYGGAVDEFTQASKYPFFIKLNDAGGLLLGQHVYVEPDLGQSIRQDGLWLPGYYLCDRDSEPYVWAANKLGRLYKQEVELGEYDISTDTYQIVSGITAEDYIAFPDDTCEEGVRTERYDEQSFGGEVSGSDTMDFEEDMYVEPGDILAEEGVFYDDAEFSEEALG